MKTRLQLALTAAVILASVVALSRFLHWMNQPSDASLYLGIAGILALAVVAPSLISFIWHPATLARFIAKRG